MELITIECCGSKYSLLFREEIGALMEKPPYYNYREAIKPTGQDKKLAKQAKPDLIPEEDLSSSLSYRTFYQKKICPAPCLTGPSTRRRFVQLFVLSDGF